MTKARDLSNLISTGVPNSLITLDANEIPNIDAGKITTGQFADARIADLSATKLTGSIADARIPESAVSQHATSFDDNKIVNDISTLAIRQASNENKGAYNTNSMYVDVFQDTSGYVNGANTIRDTNEYISTISQTGTAVPSNTKVYLKANSVANGTTTITDHSGTSTTLAMNNGAKHITQPDVPIGATSSTKSTTALWVDGNNEAIEASYSDFSSKGIFNTNDFTLAGWFRFNSVTSAQTMISFGGLGASTDYQGWSWTLTGGVMKFFYYKGGSAAINLNSNNLGLSTDTWYHLAVTRSNSGQLKFWKNGVLDSTHTAGTNMDTHDSVDLRIGRSGDGTKDMAGRMDDIIINNGTAIYTGNFTPPTVYLGLTNVVNATGNFTSNNITAPSSVNKMGAIITYQNQAGVNALNTDIVLKLSADGGSNFTTATMTAMPDFASGIKMAKVNDLTIGNAGTSLKYKIEFANQAQGSKEARIRGVSLQY